MTKRAGNIKHDNVVILIYSGTESRGQFSPCYGLEFHYPIMSKLRGLGNQTYRQIEVQQPSLYHQTKRPLKDRSLSQVIQ